MDLVNLWTKPLPMCMPLANCQIISLRGQRSKGKEAEKKRGRESRMVERKKK